MYFRSNQFCSTKCSSANARSAVAVLYIVSDIFNAQAYWTNQRFPVRNIPLEIKQYHALMIVCGGLH